MYRLYKLQVIRSAAPPRKDNRFEIVEISRPPGERAEADSRRTEDALTRSWALSENLVIEAFGAIHSAGEQPGDVAVMTGSTMKQRAVLVDRKVRRDRRRELHQLHVLLCVVARRHVAAADSAVSAQLGARRSRASHPAERSPSGAATFSVWGARWPAA